MQAKIVVARYFVVTINSSQNETFSLHTICRIPAY